MDGLQSLGAQAAGEAPPAFQRHIGIAAALKDQIAVQDAVLDGAVNQGARVPDIGGTEQVQARERGDHFDGRGGAARSVDVESGDQAAGIRVDDGEADGAQGKALRSDGLRDRRRRTGQAGGGQGPGGSTERDEQSGLRESMGHPAKVAQHRHPGA